MSCVLPSKIANNVVPVVAVSYMNWVPCLPRYLVNLGRIARIGSLGFTIGSWVDALEHGQRSHSFVVGCFADDGCTGFGVLEVMFSDMCFKLTVPLGAFPVISLYLSMYLRREGIWSVSL